MYYVVGLTTDSTNDIGFVLWNAEKSTPSFVDSDEMTKLIESGLNIANVAIKNNEFVALDVPFNKLPIYNKFGKYLGATPNIYVLRSNETGTCDIVNNDLAFASVDSSTIKSYIFKKYVCNATLVNGEISVKPIATVPVSVKAPVKEANSESASTMSNSGIVIFGTPKADTPCTEFKVTITVSKEEAVNLFNAIGDLFIDDNGIGAWAYKQLSAELTMQTSANTLICSNVKITGITDTLSELDDATKQFHRNAIDRISEIDYTAIFRKLIEDAGKQYCTVEELQWEMWQLPPKISAHLVRLGDNSVIGPIDAEKTLASFKADAYLQSLREYAGLK